MCADGVETEEHIMLDCAAYSRTRNSVIPELASRMIEENRETVMKELMAGKLQDKALILIGKIFEHRYFILRHW